MNSPAHNPTLSEIYTQLEHLLGFIEQVRQGKPITWLNCSTGELKLSSPDDNLSYIEDQLLCLSGDIETLNQRLLQLAGATNEAN